MIIKDASFLIGAVSPVQYPEDQWPEIALCGRSNVGKSSLINAVIKRKNLARTSSQPGKTQQLNYYQILSEPTSFYLVDLPGYGFAKVSKYERAKWGKFIQSYLLEREYLSLVIQVVDIRHAPSADDVHMYEWLRYYNKPVQVICTKCDKISKGKFQAHVHLIQKKLGMEHKPLIFSAETKYGLAQVHTLLASVVDDSNPLLPIL